MSIELILLSSSINFIAFSYFYNDLIGQIFVFFILTVSAAEAAIGLAIIVIFFRINRFFLFITFTYETKIDIYKNS